MLSSSSYRSRISQITIGRSAVDRISALDGTALPATQADVRQNSSGNIGARLGLSGYCERASACPRSNSGQTGVGSQHSERVMDALRWHLSNFRANFHQRESKQVQEVYVQRHIIHCNRCTGFVSEVLTASSSSGFSAVCIDSRWSDFSLIKLSFKSTVQCACALQRRRFFRPWAVAYPLREEVNTKESTRSTRLKRNLLRTQLL